MSRGLRPCAILGLQPGHELVVGDTGLQVACPALALVLEQFMREIAAAGETFSWDRDVAEATARGWWFPGRPGRTIVAVDDGVVLGTAVTGPNHGGPASHVATASFMVDPAHHGRGVGRALGERVLELARVDGYHGMQFNAEVETNGPAVHLWRSLGFEVLATVPEGLHHPTDGYVGLHIMYQRL